ncbi:MAG: membrane protein insertase YidC [Candidatus Omnitrophota bacterium]
MNKRLILAVALSFLVMLTWAKMAQKFYPIEQQGVTEHSPQVSPNVFTPEQTQVSLPAASLDVQNEVLVSVFSHDRELIFNPASASLKKIIFSQYSDYEVDLGQGFYLTGENLVFTQKTLNSQEAIFVYQDSQKRIIKHYNYSDPSFVITLDIEIENLSEQPLPYPPGLILGTISLDSRGLDARFKEIFVKQPERMLRLKPNKETRVQHSGEFFGFRDRYFCGIIIPMSYPETLQIIRPDRVNSNLLLSRPMINLLPSQIGHLQYQIYLGPQQTEFLKAFSSGAEEVMYYGFFDPIAKVLLGTLRFFYRIVHNWGLAIIILSILIFFVLMPLSIKQMRSTKQMQELQPKIEELRKAYKDNPQRLNKETMELYRKYKINPLGGCLPMVLQIPVFFSLYQALIRFIELKGAHFLWIKDLSMPDRLVASPEINILPILMAISMFLQQKTTMSAMSGSSSEQQRMMSFLFPILFGFIFYKMPSGLVLYWFVNGVLMFVNQMKMKVSNEPIKH